MTFKVNIVGGLEKKDRDIDQDFIPPLRIEKEEFGINCVLKLREEIKEDIAMAYIRGEISELAKVVVELYLTFEEAVATKHFAETNEIVVTVPTKFLNQFCTVVLDKTPGCKTDEVYYGYKNELNMIAIQNAWRKVGYPLEWDKEDKKVREVR